MPNLFQALNWAGIRLQYDSRVATHETLRNLYRRQRLLEFVELALGISDSSGNYSANEHRLGPQILGANLNAEDQVWRLAERLMTAIGQEVPELIKAANIRGLAISVGSEMSCMLSPADCWVTNTRTVYTHLVFFHGGIRSRHSVNVANEALEMFRQHDRDSEMNYGRWMDPFHFELLQTLEAIKLEGDACARAAGVRPGSIKYLWTDAIASAFYDRYGRPAFRMRAA